MTSKLWKAALAALSIFAINGLINYTLIMPLDGVSDEFNAFRVHLDDGVFILIFVLVAILFFAMFAVLPRERGYLYLGVISLLTALLLFAEWQGKECLFGPFPEIPHLPLAIKGGIMLFGFSFLSYLLGTSGKKMTRALTWSNGALWAVILCFTATAGSRSPFTVLNLVFFVLVLLNIALSLSQTLSMLRSKESRAELRQIAGGFFLFLIVLLPDPGKDLLEAIQGRALGYRLVYWEECLEDTMPWALLALVTVYGAMFFRRFVHTLKHNQQEVDTRQRLDRLLSAMRRAYRISDLEQSVIREGSEYFSPYSFVLAKYDEETRQVEFEGTESPSSVKDNIRAALRSVALRQAPGEVTVTPSTVLGAAGGMKNERLFLAVCSRNGGAIELEERDQFTLSLMSKYVSIFYEYFQLMENKLKELRQTQADRSPWLSKLFMQIAEKERTRLASDLHDEVLQELLNIRRIADRAVNDERLTEELEQIRLGLDNAEYMIRETCRELMPPFLSDRGVLHAVSGLVDKTRLRADFQLEFQAEPIIAPLSDEQNTTIYRVVQELVNNAMKHSQASHVRLEVGQDEETGIYIRYADDGKGMTAETDEEAEAANRFGLRGIAERIRMIGGELEIRSAPGQGVVIHCSL